MNKRWRLEAGAVALAVLPIVVAIVRKWQQHWVPIGDNALIEIRAGDVFSLRHFPFLGTWSSASLSAGTDLNHPGPLLFDLLAVPVKLFGGPRGVALGIGLINIAAMAGIAAVGHRVRGRTGALAATLVAAVLAFTLGSTMLTDPWNPHVLVLPCLLLFMLVWGVASGHLELLAWLVAIGSLSLQTHLGYAYLVPAMILTALAGLYVVHRRRWATDAEVRDDDLSAIRRSGYRALIVGVVLWWQPIVEQLFGEGRGNMARIITSTGGDEPVIGLRIGTRILAGLLALPPWWNRSSFLQSVPYTRYNADGRTITPVGLPSLAPSVAALLVLGATLTLIGGLAHRRRDRPGVVAIAVAVIALVVALASLTIMPIGPLGLTPHQMRWLWSLGAFVLFAIVLALIGPHPQAPRMTGALAVLVALVSIANLPGYVQLAGPDSFQESIPVARELSAQLRQYRTEQSLVLDTSNLRYLEPNSAVVVGALLEAGVDVRVREEGLVRQLGNRRRSSGTELFSVVILEGRAALTTPEGSQRIAFTSPLAVAEIEALESGEIAMTDAIALKGIVFSSAGEEAVAAGAFGLTRDEIITASFDAPTFVGSGLAAELVAADALVLEASDQALFATTSDLRRRVDITTAAVFVRPT